MRSLSEQAGVVINTVFVCFFWSGQLGNERAVSTYTRSQVDFSSPQIIGKPEILDEDTTRLCQLEGAGLSYQSPHRHWIVPESQQDAWVSCFHPWARSMTVDNIKLQTVAWIIADRYWGSSWRSEKQNSQTIGEVLPLPRLGDCSLSPGPLSPPVL